MRELPLSQALAELERRPQGVLLGVLPYPSSTASPESTPASLLLFDQRQQPGPDTPPPLHAQPFLLTRPFHADWTSAGYLDGVRRIKDYLSAGDAYQVNLAQRFTATFTGNPREAFAALQQAFQPPFAAYVDLGDRQILSLSPESFLAVENRQVLTHPIKGTRPRGTDAHHDALLAADLLGHPKDRAENLMIVDLLRNDLGKVCAPGSVQVPALFTLESHPNVHHLVSTISGQLRPDTGIPELLTAAFPGGSITGAPKKRAMEIIADLEPHPRDVYCGSIFWALPGGRLGSNIAIRTFLAKDGVIHGWAGAGIVADSEPEAEEAECRHKLQPMMAVLENLNKG